MAVLFESREIVLGLTLLFGGVFFFVDWILQQPSIWRFVSTPIFQLANNNHDLKQKTELQRGLRFRLVCAVHNTPQSVLSVWALLSGTLWEDSFNAMTPLAHMLVMISCGFFIYDAFVAIKTSKKEGIAPILHGVICFSCMFFILLTEKFAFYGVSSIIWELSTPFVHLGWFLYNVDMKQTRLFLNTAVMMLLSFALCRICWGTYVAIKFFRTMAGDSGGSIDTLTLLGPISVCLSGNLLNYFWFWKLVKLGIRHLSSMRSNGSIPKKMN